MTLIPIFTLDINGEPVRTCDARDLHSSLGVGKDFSNWIKDRIEGYGFAENEDYVISNEIYAKLGENTILDGQQPKVGRPAIEYHISLDMAKELAMVEKNEKGREIRKYFIRCEKELRQQSLPFSQKNQHTTMTSIDFARVASIREENFQRELRGLTLRVESLINHKGLRLLKDESTLGSYVNTQPDPSKLVTVDVLDDKDNKVTCYHLNQEAVFTLAVDYSPRQRDKIIQRWLELNSTYELPEELRYEAKFVDQEFALFASKGFSKAQAAQLVVCARKDKSDRDRALADKSHKDHTALIEQYKFYLNNTMREIIAAKAVLNDLKKESAGLKQSIKEDKMSLKASEKALKRDEAILNLALKLASDNLFRTDDDETAYIIKAKEKIQERVKALT